MEHEQYTREQLIIIIVLCALLHMLFIGIFFFWQHANIAELNLFQQYEKRIEELFEKQTKTPLTPEEEKELFEWVNGQEKGNSVSFDDSIEDEQGQPDAIDKGSAIEYPHDQIIKEEEVTPQIQAQEEKIEKKSEVIVPTMPDKNVTDTTLFDQTQQESLPEQNKQVTMPTPKKNAQKQQDYEKKSVTLADITKGFVQKMSHSSEHLVNAIGGKAGKVTEEQLRYEHYFKKISYHFSNSDRIHRSNHIEELMQARNQIRNSVLLQIAINRDGSLLDVRLASSCGSKVIDDYFIFIFRDASTSFPTIPQFLPAPLRFGYSIGLQEYVQTNSSPIRFTIH